MTRRIIAVFILAFGTSSHAQTQVPNTFQSGQPAHAAEVNENFDALESAIDQNAAAIQNIPAGPEGPQGPAGPAGPAGPEGPPGADLSNEVSIIEGEQLVQNDRIDYIDDAVQENTLAISGLLANSGVKVFAGGVEIGRFLSFANINNYDSQIWLVSETGYLFLISPLATGTDSRYLPVETIYFAEPNCSGQAYVADQGYSLLAAKFGTVFKAAGPFGAPAYYAPPNSTGTSQQYQSWDNGGGWCSNNVGSISMFSVFPNDEAVTGISSADPIGNFTIGVP